MFAFGFTVHSQIHQYLCKKFQNIQQYEVYESKILGFSLWRVDLNISKSLDLELVRIKSFPISRIRFVFGLNLRTAQHSDRTGALKSHVSPEFHKFHRFYVRTDKVNLSSPQDSSSSSPLGSCELAMKASFSVAMGSPFIVQAGV